MKRQPGTWNAKRGEGEGRKWLLDHADYDKPYCLIWPFSRTRGYGHFSFEGELMYAHRYMCELVKGPPPSPEHHAAHSCNRGEDGCVNPTHLDWKTPSQNQLDKRVSGTASRSGGRYKLTPDDVAKIRALKGRETQDAMARMFGVSRRNIGAVLSGKSWPTGGYSKRGFKPGDPRNPAVKRKLARLAAGFPFGQSAMEK